MNFELIGIYFSNISVGDHPTAFAPLFTHGPLVLLHLGGLRRDLASLARCIRAGQEWLLQSVERLNTGTILLVHLSEMTL